MRTARRATAVVATLSVLGMITGCSTATADVESELWLQTDEAQNKIYDVLTELETSISPVGVLIDRFPEDVLRWNTDEDVLDLPLDEGTAVVYNSHQRTETAQFDVFVASGRDDEAQAWLDPRPRRVYTCYRLKVAIADGLVSGWYQVSDHDKQLACPDALVESLGDGAQYREPWVFDG